MHINNEKLQLDIHISTESEEKIAVRREVVDGELRIRFLKGIEDFIQISSEEEMKKVIFINRESKLKLTFNSEKEN